MSRFPKFVGLGPAGHYRGRRMRDVPLPGDETQVLQEHIRRALVRDERMNEQEVEVWECMRFCRYYGTERCIARHCVWCGGLWFDEDERNRWADEDERDSWDRWP